MNKLCFMFGHRDTPASVLPEIERAVESFHLKYEIGEFVVGNHGSFDRMAAQAVRTVQKKYPSIRLTLLLAYHPSAQKADTLSGYDDTLYPDGMENTPARFALPRANQYMVRHANAVICYVGHTGNTHALLEEAERCAAKAHTPLINLAAGS